MAAPHPVTTALRNRGRRTRTRVGCATAIRFWGRSLTGSPSGLHAPCSRDSREYAWSTKPSLAREGVSPERLASDPVPGRAQNMRQERLNRRCGVPGRLRSLERHRSGGSRRCRFVRPAGERLRAPKRCRVGSPGLAEVLREGPGQCRAAPGGTRAFRPPVGEAPGVRSRSASRARAGNRDAEDPTQLCFDGVKAGVGCAGHDLARRVGQRGADGFLVLGHNRSRLRPCCLGVGLVVGAVPRDGLRQPLLEVRRGFEAEALACSSCIQPSTRLSVRL